MLPTSHALVALRRLIFSSTFTANVRRAVVRSGAIRSSSPGAAKIFSVPHKRRDTWNFSRRAAHSTSKALAALWRTNWSSAGSSASRSICLN